MFDFDLTEELKFVLQKLAHRDKKRVEIVNKKIKEIISCDANTISHYKNLRYELKELKRVHIDGNFVLTFKVDIGKNFILFVELEHHDNVYQ